jgi:hypothetical protein
LCGNGESVKAPLPFFYIRDSPHPLPFSSDSFTFCRAGKDEIALLKAGMKKIVNKHIKVSVS